MPPKKEKPIFYDEKKLRWKIFLAIFVASLIFVGLNLGTLTYKILTNPKLPDIQLSQVAAIGSSFSGPLKIQQNPDLLLNDYKARLQTYIDATKNITAASNPGKPKIIAFYVNWDQDSFLSLKQNIDSIDILIPEWLHLSGIDGSIAIDDRTIQTDTINFIKKEKPNLQVMPLINNFNPTTQLWDDQVLYQVLADPISRQNLEQNLLNYVKMNNFAGINIDFENIPDTSQANLQTFMKDLYDLFHANNLLVSQDLPLADNSVNYAYLSTVNDYVIIMAYDENFAAGAFSGPVASQNWFVTGVQSRFLDIPSSKLIVSIGNYGYDWITGAASGQEISFNDISLIATNTGNKIGYDTTYLNPYLSYVDAKNQTHAIWFLDGVTALNQVIVSQKNNPAGYAVWRMGSEDPSIWKMFEKLPTIDSSTYASVESIGYGYGVFFTGLGEILKIKEGPADGKRTIVIDPQTGYIINEDIISPPRPYVVERRGFTNPKQVALTFDDGPDPKYTPQILEILKNNDVKATFFVIGAQAELNKNILQDIYNQGHDIGGHTFTHPNIAKISPQQLMLELNTTDRLFESVLGRDTLLFRSPYGEDSEPETPEQIMPIKIVNNMGYYNIGMMIVPNDWRNPGVEEIVDSTIDQLNKNLGNVVLLHDGGGDREETVEALQPIISRLKENGYTFVTVSQLMGLSRDQVMPSKSNNAFGFDLLAGIYYIFTVIFYIGTALGICRLFVIGILALIEKRVRKSDRFFPEYKPSVSVLVPAWNEAKVINKTISILLKSDYENLEVIVVDDGSKDNTYDKALKHFGNNPKVKIFRRERNYGKSSALNFALTHSTGEVIVIQDADTILRKDAISKLVRRFRNEKVGAVAGNAKVGNRINFWTKLQALEYIISQNMDRRAFDMLNCVTVVPGALGAWKKDLVLEAGGFTSDTLAEDAELTLRILKLGYRIEYEEEAVAYTEAPENLKVFLKQRFRWMFGTFQSVRKHIDVLFNPKYGYLGLISLPNVLIFQIIFPMLSPLIDIYVFLAIVFGLITTSQHPNADLSGLEKILIYYLVFLVVDIIIALIAFSLEKKEDKKLILWFPLQRVVYRVIIYFVSIQSILTAIKGPLVLWETKKRTSSVGIRKNLAS